MELSQLAQLGEFVGGIAVVVTLVYLGVQLRQGNRQQDRESSRTLLRAYNEMLAQIMDPSFTDLYRRGSKDFERLSRTEQQRLAVWLEQLMRTCYAGFYTDPRVRSPVTHWVLLTFATQIRLPGFQQWWRSYSPPMRELRPEFVDRMEELGEPYPGYRLYDQCPWIEPTEEELAGAARP